MLLKNMILGTLTVTHKTELMFGAFGLFIE